MRDGLIVFAKEPIPGRVKTRLAAEVGVDLACAVYARLLRYTLEVTGNSEGTRFLYLADRAALVAPGFPTAGFVQRQQEGGDLGQRVHAAFVDAFEAGLTRVVLVGSDCPTLTPALLEEALGALGDHDCVFGPTRDGGYYLIGQAHRSRPELFADIEWSTNRVWATTQERISAHGLRAHTLPVLEDIDDAESLARYPEFAG